MQRKNGRFYSKTFDDKVETEVEQDQDQDWREAGEGVEGEDGWREGSVVRPCVRLYSTLILLSLFTCFCHHHYTLFNCTNQLSSAVFNIICKISAKSI